MIFTSPCTGRDRLQAIEVVLLPGRPGGFAGTVRLRGEHDIATNADLERALRSVEGNVLVDLPDCEFIDSSILNTLIHDTQRRELDENGLEVILPDEDRAVSTTFRLTGLDHFFTIHESFPLDGSVPR